MRADRGPAARVQLISLGAPRRVRPGHDALVATLRPWERRLQRETLVISAMRGAAAALSVPVFSRTALMRAWEAAGTPPEDMLHADGLHHNDRGYACVAQALASSILRGLRAAAPVMAAGR